MARASAYLFEGRAIPRRPATRLPKWLRSVTRGKEAATARNHADALRPVIERFDAKPLQKLTTADIEDLVDRMLTNGRRPRRKTRYRA